MCAPPCPALRADSQCLSCYTTGPRCTGLNTGGESFSYCTASTCYCNQPWVGPTCASANVGTCYTAKDGAFNCETYENCCPAGWSTNPAQSKNTGECGCQCVPPAGGGNGFTLSGCGSAYNQYCGTCRGCTNTQLSAWYTNGCPQS